MKRGLVIGKFLPVHNGHIELIEFAKVRCDELIVSMSYTRRDTIDPQLRIGWLREIFKGLPSVRVELLEDDFDDETLPWDRRISIWSEIIRSRFPGIDLIFSSENYGDLLGSSLGIPHIVFDKERKWFPVSSTLIRSQPFKYWQFIPPEVRPYFVKKLCFYGPESTGKSTMAMELAAKYDTQWVPEVARELINSNDFSLDDIRRIGRAQTERVLELTKSANKILICDTDVITTEIYSKVYLDQVPSELFELEKAVKYDQYFFFDIDVPWVDDGLRDLRENRDQMREIFMSELERRGIGYILVRGSWGQRQKIVTDYIDALP